MYNSLYTLGIAKLNQNGLINTFYHMRKYTNVAGWKFFLKHMAQILRLTYLI
jgi:hypothetical protein